MLNCLFFRIFSSVRMKWVWASTRYLAFGRVPACRRLAKCDAGPPFEGGFSPLRRGFSALGWRIAPAFFRVAPTLAQRWFFLSRRARTRSLPEKPHTVATRASRRAAGARHTRRVDRADFSHGGKIGTFGTPERDQPLAATAVGLDQNPVFP